MHQQSRLCWGAGNATLWISSPPSQGHLDSSVCGGPRWYSELPMSRANRCEGCVKGNLYCLPQYNSDFLAKINAWKRKVTGHQMSPFQ